MAIRDGTFGIKVPSAATASTLTFRQFAEVWMARRGYQLVRAKENDYRLAKLCSFMLEAPPILMGDKEACAVTPGDIEAFRHSRRSAGLSAVTVNHDLKLLRKMFAWGVRERLLPATPFKVGTETAIRLDPETPRERRFRGDDDETRLLNAANSHLRGLIIAMLDTCCRPGELLSLQWEDVDLAARQFTVRAHKAKTRRDRRLPISARLNAILEMRKLDPAGDPLGPKAFVFGNAIGEQVRSVRTAWSNACRRAGLHDLHLADLRHEAASRFEEAGVPTTYVSKFLGHQNLTTTTRYLNTTLKGLHRAIDQLESSRNPILLQVPCKNRRARPATNHALEGVDKTRKSLPS
ncbi:MAG: site-specific integrase [Lysobacter sp.]|nr:site-specific integrase [Lysobacter sp.]MBA3639840.1 site-specific integrase [Acidobacteriota bacterium]